VSYSLAFSQAIVTLLYVNDKVALGMYDFVPTKVLSEELNIPVPSAAKILQALTRAGIIETREGAKGGVRLAVDPEKVTILDIFNSIEAGRPLFRTQLDIKVTGDRPRKAQQEISQTLNEAEQLMKEHLKGVTLKALSKRIGS